MRAFRVKLFKDALPVVIVGFFYTKLAAKWLNSICRQELSLISTQISNNTSRALYLCFHLSEVIVQLASVQEKHYSNYPYNRYY